MMEVIDSPDIFDVYNEIAAEDWDYFKYLKAWTENKTDILKLYKNNSRNLMYFEFFKVLSLMFWPIIALLVFYPAAIPGFVIGYFALSFVYYMHEASKYYVKRDTWYLGYMMAWKVHHYSLGNKYRVPTHPFFMLSFWKDWRKVWWSALVDLNKPAAEPSEPKTS
jgi:hypothetical protein